MSSFNSRSREGSDLQRKMSKGQITAVSIHAPVKGATLLHWLEKVTIWVSIHAPVKGATYGCCRCAQYGDVSIHAPVKGATEPRRPEGKLYDLFQFTLP